MKRLWFLVAVISLVFGYIEISAADDVEFRTVVSRNDEMVGGEFHLDIEMQITSGASPRTLNSMTVDVVYGSELTEWSTNPGTTWAFSFLDGYTRTVDKLSGFYRIIVTGGSVNANEEPTPPGDPAGWDATTAWKKVVTLRWTINTATSVNITINDATDAAAYFDNYTNAPTGGATDWTVSNQDLGDVSLPVELATFKASVEGERVVLDWVTESELNNLGFEVYRALQEEGDYVLLSSFETNPDLEGQGNSATRYEYSYTDKSVEPETDYFYKLADLDYGGVRTFHGPISVSVPATLKIPTAFKLHQNYPNPFNPTTTLRFEIPESRDGEIETSLMIYNVLGQVVKVFRQGKLEAGVHKIMWDGTTESGNVVPSGVYFAIFKAGNHTQTVKMAFVR